MADDHKCPRCLGPLKVVTVRVPVELERMEFTDHGLVRTKAVVDHEEREEVSDCPRCTGGF